jgi:ribosomal protein S18 acetylase RimI-like enzyme
MENIVCRKANKKDFEDICKLRHQLLDDPEDRLTLEYAPYNEKNDRAWIQKCLQSKRIVILVAENSKGICAHSIVLIEKVAPKMQAYFTYKKKARLVHLYVDIDKRHQGIGKTLVQYTLDYLKEKGVEFVDLECYMHNDKAAALYNKVGFKDVFIEKRFMLLEK